MNGKPSVVPRGKDATAIQEIGGMILARFPDAEIDVRPSSDEKGAWTLLVYVENEDERYGELADLVYGRLAELQYDEGVNIEMLSFDKALERSIRQYMQAHQKLRMVADSPVLTSAFSQIKQDAEASEATVSDMGHATREAKRSARKPASHPS